MDVQVAASGPCERTLTIKIPAAQVKRHVDEMFRAAANQVKLKGFRPGKIPRAVLEKKYGASIHAEAKKELIQRSVADACRQHELAMIGRAKLDGLTDAPLGTEDVEFRVTLDVRPELELKQVTEIELKAMPTEVTDEDMERALKELSAQKRTLESVQDAIGEIDFAKADMVFSDAAGKEISRRDGAQINPGIPIAGTDHELFKQALVGKSAGDTIELELTFPDNFAEESVRGQAGKVTIHVHEVLRVQDATLDDEFAKEYEFDTLDALKTELRARIGDQKVTREKARQADALFEIIANENQFGIPQSLVQEEMENGLAQFAQRMKNENVSDDVIKQKVEEAQEPAREDAERRVRMFFLIDAIARKHEIRVTESDVELELQRIAAQHNASIEDVQKHFEDRQQANQLRLGLLERNVRDFLIANARITDN